MEPSEIDANAGMVFVVMPFADKYKAVYTSIIHPIVTKEFGYECIRADEIARPGDINKDIAESISRADFVIADLTGANPNVMYELGLCHALGRDTIMIAQDTEGLPFDVRAYRVIEYDDSIEGRDTLVAELQRFIRNVDGARREVRNPVVDFLTGNQTGQPAEQLLDPISCFQSLCRSLELFRDKKADDEDIKLLRALPTEMSQSNFRNQVGVAGSTHMEKYEKLIKEYVELPDLDDETVFGCPPNLSCLKETLAQIKASYFPCPAGGSTSNLMEVSAVGFHPYLRRYSLFLLGKKKKWQDEPQNYQTGFIFFLNRQGLPVNGIFTSDSQTLRILFHLWTLMLEEIDHISGGVPLTTPQTYTITRDNHVTLFRNIADKLISTFNEVHRMNVVLEVKADGDDVNLKVQ